MNDSATAAADEPRVSAEVIAKRYSVSPRSVLNWKDQGKIPFIQIGRTVRFIESAVVAALEGHPAKEGASE